MRAQYFHLYLLRFFFWLIIFISPITELFAQSPVYRHYTIKDGLPSSEVYHVFQDSKGYIWFATGNGVCRFDGYSFKKFNLENGLPDNSVFEIYEDKKGRIWFIPYSFKLSFFENDSIHLYKYNKKLSDCFTRLPCPAKDGLYIDEKDNVYMNDMYNGLFTVSAQGVCKRIQYNSGYLVYFVDKKPIFSVIKGNNQNLVKIIKNNKECYSFNYSDYFNLNNMPSAITNGNRLFISSGKQFCAFEKNQLTQKKELESLISWISFDQDNQLWIGQYEKGACYFKNGNPEARSSIQFLPDKTVTSILVDREKGVWFTTSYYGVYYLPSQYFLSYTSRDKFTSDFVGAVAACKDTVWAGLNDGNICRLSPKDNKTFHIKKVSIFYSLVYNAKSNCLYFGGDKAAGKIFGNHEFFYSNNHPSHKHYLKTYFSCRNILLTKDNSFWFGLHRSLAYIDNGQLKYLSFENSKKEMRVNALCFDKDSNIWVGSLKGLWKYIKPDNTDSSGKYVYFGDHHPLLKTRIVDLQKGLNGELWIATKGAGVLVYNYDSIISINTKNGLLSNTVNKILIDGNRIWVGTSTGLNKITLSGYNHKYYSIEKITTIEGLISNEINDLAISGTTIYVATPEGLCFFDFNNVKPNHTPPPIVIKSIRINYKDTLSKESYTLSHDQNHIQISFAGLSYRNAGKLLYKYRLTGTVNEWSYTTNPVVQYPAMPPGEYVFQVSAANDDGYWSQEPLCVKFNILHPFYETWLFRIAVILFVFIIALLFFRVRFKILREKNRMRNDLHQYMLKALGQQMNPHFIFNSLNSIQF